MTIEPDWTESGAMTRDAYLLLTAEVPVALPDNARLAERLTAAIASTRADWHRQANCRGCDPDMFFLPKGQPTEAAKAVCAGCVVREDCLEHALTANEKFGIWGGLSRRERLYVRRRRARDAQRGAA